MLTKGIFSQSLKAKADGDIYPAVDTRAQPVSATIYPGAIIDVDTTPEVRWTIEPSDATDVQSWIYHEKEDGSRTVIGGAGGLDGQSAYEYAGNIASAWEEDVPLVKIVVVTTMTFPDGSVTTEETVFYKYSEPSAPGDSTVAVYSPAEPWYGTTDINFTLYSDHNKGVEDRFLMVGLQRFEIPSGGMQTITTKVKTGTHEAYVFASFLDGTSSKSDVMTVTIVGPNSPAEQAELEAVVDQRMRDSLTGSHAENLHTIFTEASVGSAGYDAGRKWELYDAYDVAFTNEINRWLSIYEDPDVTQATYDMADNALVALSIARDSARVSAQAWRDLDDGNPMGLSFGLAASAQMFQVYIQYFDWIRSVPTSPLYLDVP